MLNKSLDTHAPAGHHRGDLQGSYKIGAFTKRVRHIDILTLYEHIIIGR